MINILLSNTTPLKHVFTMGKNTRSEKEKEANFIILVIINLKSSLLVKKTLTKLNTAY